MRMPTYKKQKAGRVALQVVEAPGIEPNNLLKSQALSYESGGPFNPPAPIADNEAGEPVEVALAFALTEATKATQWGLVAKLAGELEARRLARGGSNVVSSENARRDR